MQRRSCAWSTPQDEQWQPVKMCAALEPAARCFIDNVERNTLTLGVRAGEMSARARATAACSYLRSARTKPRRADST